MDPAIKLRDHRRFEHIGFTLRSEEARCTHRIRAPASLSAAAEKAQVLIAGGGPTGLWLS